MSFSSVRIALLVAGALSWSFVARADEPSVACPSPSPSPCLAVELRTAVFHIDSERPVSLEMREGPGRYRAVCTSPCDVELPLDALYRVGGKTVRSSRDFVVTARPGERVVIGVDPRSKSPFAVGMVLIGFGSAFVGGGSLYWLGESVSNVHLGDTSDTAVQNQKNRESQTNAIAALLIGFGVAALATGIPLAAANNSTRVRLPGDEPPQKTQSSEEARGPEFVTTAGREWTPPLPRTLPIRFAF